MRWDHSSTWNKWLNHLIFWGFKSIPLLQILVFYIEILFLIIHVKVTTLCKTIIHLLERLLKLLLIHLLLLLHKLLLLEMRIRYICIVWEFLFFLMTSLISTIIWVYLLLSYLFLLRLFLRLILSKTSSSKLHFFKHT